ncbi:MAG: polysaccharide biosynthesis protein [Chloroflexi bacterium RBG_13_50_21]|nr:MAG: polysaccharide biosynthesis protein [Chloroflexi bacterium RBG_13_50_21]OGO63927.1 MAG: polysaccharide biosynthesis protein [Chloroflexi bacterium RBG_19FT_COMBO_47_9]
MNQANNSPLQQIPMSSPDLTDAERQAVARVLETPNLSMGSQITAFEESIKAFTGSQHAIGVSSGTAGLHLCVRAAGIQAGDLVITTPFSFVASSNVLLYEGAVPIYVDVEPRTGNIDPHLIFAAAQDIIQGGRNAQAWLPPKGASVKAKLKAILPVDVFGQPADLDPILKTAWKFKLKVIEDSCEALGAIYQGRSAGTLGDYGVFAFYPNKQITTGEGGMIITDDLDAANLMRALRNQGRAPGDTWLQHTHLGYNYRLDEMSAALGVTQMQRLDELLSKRDQVADWYNQRICEIPGIEAPTVARYTTRVSWFVYVVRLAQGLNRDLIAKKLGDLGVPARPYFLPIHLQPYMMERFGYKEGIFPVTEDLGRRGLALPFSGVMEEGLVERVCQALRRVIQ